ncbi:MAG: Endonuclease/exonuclease/phosphatase [Bacteroidetes bacterium]|nr:Endonuclease/exonuclease/phosphatase [Bacteroidota bacterium]
MISASGQTEFLDNVVNFTTPGKYTRSSFNDGPDTDNSLFYRQDKVAFISASYLPTALRDIAEYVVQPLNSLEQLRIYSVHLHSSDGLSFQSLRRGEATVLRNHVNALPPGTNFIIVGDYNAYSSSDSGFQELVKSTSNNNGRAFDPLNLLGSWNNNSSISIHHTQSTRVRQFEGGANGGLDDRFDIILTSTSMQDNIFTSTYKPYGNDGNHFNDSINRLPNTAVQDSFATALHNCSDHLPVLASFIFPRTGLPIQLSSFHGTMGSGSVLLTWETLSETNNYGFQVQEKLGNEQEFRTIPNSFVPGNGTTLIPHSYSFTDTIAPPGNWLYRLKQIDLDGSIHYTEAIAVDVLTSVHEASPATYSLLQNYPNPFNPFTRIAFSVEKPGLVRVEVYNILGQKIAQVFNDYAQAGRRYSVEFDGSGIPSGVYIYRLLINESSLTHPYNLLSSKRMVLIK